MGIFDQEFVNPPTLAGRPITIQVNWVAREELERRSGNSGCYGLSEIGAEGAACINLYCLKPDSFNGVLVEALGHELLHALGATHNDG